MPTIRLEINPWVLANSLINFLSILARNKYPMHKITDPVSTAAALHRKNVFVIINVF